MRTGYSGAMLCKVGDDLFLILNVLGSEIELGAQIKFFYDSARAASTLPSNRNPCGGFYSTVEGAPHTILRLKEGMDTSLPSTNGVCASNLFRLGAILNEPTYTDLARETVSAFEVEMLQYPWLFPSLLAGVVNVRLGTKTWAVIGLGDDEMSKKVISKFHTSPTNALENLVVVKGLGSWLADKNSMLGELVKAGKDGCFLLQKETYRLVSEADLLNKPA
jgi:uncharacterized protein YyaL (SSP411 family)